jgi:hypothetical protein
VRRHSFRFAVIPQLSRLGLPSALPPHYINWFYWRFSLVLRVDLRDERTCLLTYSEISSVDATSSNTPFEEVVEGRRVRVRPVLCMRFGVAIVSRWN